MNDEAASRSTTTYLVDRRLDMLPGLLTTMLCSLRANEPHLAFSVVWEMDEDANILDVSFSKSVINSRASLTYGQAQDILDDTNASREPNDLHDSVRMLNKFARILRQRRIDGGALTLASPEVRFKLDEETQDPTDLSLYALKEANALVEEFMLLANITVAKKILKHFPTLSILRRHQPPTREQFAPLIAAAKFAGIKLDISTSKSLADSLDQAVRKEDPFFNKLLRMLSTRCMMPAQYFCSGEVPKDQWFHYGLATQIYTHFTSPIRRYADVMVHRLLAASIGVAQLPTEYSDRKAMQDQCAHMNRKHRAAQHAQRASVMFYMNMFFRGKKVLEEAYVLTIDLNTIRVMIPKYGLENNLLIQEISEMLGYSSFRSIPNECIVRFFSEEASEESYSLRVLQKLTVEISVVSNELGEDALSVVFHGRM